MLKWKSYYIVIVMMFIGLIIGLFIMSKQSDFYKSLEKIEKYKSYDIHVEKAYNERGTYILNKKYSIDSYTKVLGEDFGLSKDNAIWRPKNSEYIPRISDISAPFRLMKEMNSDTLKLIKGNKTILLSMNTNYN